MAVAEMVRPAPQWRILSRQQVFIEGKSSAVTGLMFRLRPQRCVYWFFNVVNWLGVSWRKLVTRIHEIGPKSSELGERSLGLLGAGENVIPLGYLWCRKDCCAFLLSAPELLR